MSGNFATILPDGRILYFARDRAGFLAAGWASLVKTGRALQRLRAGG